MLVKHRVKKEQTMPSVADREPIAASEQERSQIALVEDFFARLNNESEPDCLRLVSSTGEEIDLPEPVFHLLRQLVHDLAQGNSVTIVPVHKELTTQEAADLLNVSRQYLVELLEAGTIPFTKVGTHRRIQFGDLIDYKQRRDASRREGLSRLTKQSQKLGLYGKSSKTTERESK
jgi:excisionase family DNA binding protein